MKNCLLLSALALTVACKKNDAVKPEEPPKPEMVAVTYEVTSQTAEPFSVIRYSDWRPEETGTEGTALKDWNISGTGTFTKTVYIKRGFGAYLTAKHPTSAAWILRITTKYETVMAPGFFSDDMPNRTDHHAFLQIGNREK